MADPVSAMLSAAVRTLERVSDLDDALLAFIHSVPRDGAVVREAISLARGPQGADARNRERVVTLLRRALATGLFD